MLMFVAVNVRRSPRVSGRPDPETTPEASDDVPAVGGDRRRAPAPLRPDPGLLAPARLGPVPQGCSAGRRGRARRAWRPRLVRGPQRLRHGDAVRLLQP